MNYYTADIHFCDDKTMRVDNRPFKNVKKFDRFIIRDWNKTAKKGDTIYVVGDLLDSDGAEDKKYINGLKLIKKVKANVILIIGNNEQRIIKYIFNGNFELFAETCKQYGILEVHKSLEIMFCGETVNLVHQIKDGDASKLNFFGHNHLCSGLYHPYGLCVSCDLNHFRLFTEEILKEYIERKKHYWEPDDNCNYINPFLKEENGKIINIKKKDNIVYQNYIKNSNFSL